jgi:hypothetical protein
MESIETLKEAMASGEVDRLEQAITSKDSVKAKKLIMDKPELKKVVNKKLYELVVPSQMFMAITSEDKEKFQMIRFLLEIGADPNYRKNYAQLTLLEKAARSNDLPLAEILLANRADLCAGSVERIALDEHTTPMDAASAAYREEHFPVQCIHERFLQNHRDRQVLYNLLSEATLKHPECAIISEQFKEVFRSIIEQVREAKEAADNQGKRLMILVGEEHYDFNGLVVETMTYLAASNWCGIDTVLVEKDKELLDHFNQTGLIKTRETSWIVSLGFLPFLKSQGAVIVPIDEARNAVKDKTSEQGVYVRDQKMAALANEVMSDVLCVIGQGHLYGLLTKTDLASHFHILAISTAREESDIQEAQKFPSKRTLKEFDMLSHEQKAYDFSITFTDKVQNVCAFKQKQFKSMVSPDIAIAMVSSLLNELKSEFPKKMKFR